MHKLVLGLAVCSFLALTGGGALAAGTALGVDPQADAQRQAQTLQLTVGADIFIGDRVVTGASGQVQIKFDDSTELVVGPRSALLIEDYLLRNNGSAGKLAINALAGTFRFVTGGAPKNRYEIKTPTGTIGVRGTALDFFVGNSSTNVLLYHGAVRICNNAGECVDLDDVCDLGQYDTSQSVLIGHTDIVTGGERQALRSMFRYALSQRPLLREFRVNGAERCLARPSGNNAPASISDPGGVGQPGRRTPPRNDNVPPPSNDDAPPPPPSNDDVPPTDPVPGQDQTPPPPEEPVWNADTGCYQYSNGDIANCN